MNWFSAPITIGHPDHRQQGFNPPNEGVYLIQSRGDLGLITIRYHTAYWSGRKWYIGPGNVVFYWSVIELAPEPDNPLYYDELGRIECVAAQETVGILETKIGK